MHENIRRKKEKAYTKEELYVDLTVTEVPELSSLMVCLATPMTMVATNVRITAKILTINPSNCVELDEANGLVALFTLVSVSMGDPIECT